LETFAVSAAKATYRSLLKMTGVGGKREDAFSFLNRPRQIIIGVGGKFGRYSAFENDRRSRTDLNCPAWRWRAVYSARPTAPERASFCVLLRVSPRLI
jgi:hypothetical protein